MTNATMSFETLSAGVLAKLPNFTAEERRLALSLYSELAKGEPITADQVARSTGIPLDRTEQLLDGTMKGLVYTQDGRIVGFGGLAVKRMAHKLVLDDRELYTWCAWDSLFITHALGARTRVESRSFLSKAPITLRVTPDGVERADPATTVMSFVVPDTATFTGDVHESMAAFCHHVHFFSTPEEAREWTDDRPGTAVLSLADAFELGVRMNRTRFGIG